MTGTEKQVAWAEQLRADTLALLDRCIANIESPDHDLSAYSDPETERAARLSQLRTIREQFASIDSARVWISYRNDLGLTLKHAGIGDAASRAQAMDLIESTR